MSPHKPVLLVTGGHGTLGTVLLPTLRQRYALRIAERTRTERAHQDQTLFGDLTDPSFADRAVAGADAVLHLAAYADPKARWPDTAPNAVMTHNVLTAAGRHGVRRIVLASSNHAAGLDFRDGRFPVTPDRAAPCCPYGAAKLAEESLGRLHALHTGASVTSIRFGLVGWPLTERDYNAMWLSDTDAAALVHAALKAGGHGVHFGVSRYAESFWSLASARAELGYEPVQWLPDGAEELPRAAEPPCLMFEPVPPRAIPHPD